MTEIPSVWQLTIDVLFDPQVVGACILLASIAGLVLVLRRSEPGGGIDYIDDPDMEAVHELPLQRQERLVAHAVPDIWADPVPRDPDPTRARATLRLVTGPSTRERLVRLSAKRAVRTRPTPWFLGERRS